MKYFCTCFGLTFLSEIFDLGLFLSVLWSSSGNISLARLSQLGGGNFAAEPCVFT